MADRKICAVDGCGKPYHAHGYCSRHAYHFGRYGDPLGGRRSASPGEPMRWIIENANYSAPECLKWPFETTHHGYGTVKQNGKRRVASRVMCEVAHGRPSDQNMDAAHSCGNGHLGCVNPAHLRWATRSENIHDMKQHGSFRSAQESKSKHGMTREIAVHVRAPRAGRTHAELAEQFNASVTVIGKILRGESWNW